MSTLKLTPRLTISLKMKNCKVTITLISLVYATACLVGLLYQICLISNLYFKYHANSEIKIEIETTIKPKALSFCSRYVDHLDFARIRHEDPNRQNWTLSTHES